MAVLPEAREKTIEAMQKVVTATYADEGRLMYEFYEDVSEPNTFFIYEEWTTQALLDTHITQPHTKEFLGVIGSLLASPMKVKRYEVEG